MLPRLMKRVRGATFQKTELKITVLSASPATSNWILSCQTLRMWASRLSILTLRFSLAIAMQMKS
ncbi:hypothetical protein D3C76_773000 [compost metagenome]